MRLSCWVLALSALLVSPVVVAQTSGSNPADRDLAPGNAIFKGQVRHERPVIWSSSAPRTGEPVYPSTGDAASRYGGLKGSDLKGPNDPRLVEVHRDQVGISDRFGGEINRVIRDSGLGAQVETSTKTPGSIFGKLSRKSGEGKDYPLGRMTDLSRGRINVESNDMREVAAIDRVLRQRFGLPPHSEDSPNFMQDFMGAKDPKSGYARSHLIIRDEKGNAFELQIGTRDISRFIDAPVGATSVHDAIYKGKDLGINTPPALAKEYNQLLIDIGRANAQGKSIADDAALSQRIKTFQEAVKQSLPEKLRKPVEPEDPWKIPPGVTLLSTQGGGAVGMNAGPFKDGRWNWAEGRHGRIGMDVLRAEGTYKGTLGITSEGLRADAVIQGQAILAGISGETGRYGVGDPNGLNNAGVQGTGKAFVGADGQAAGTAAISKTGVKAVGNVNLFVGIKARGELTGTATLCGASVAATGTGEASAGAGGGASGRFQIDFAKGTVALGGEANAALGLGGGLGGTVEISVEKIIRNPGAAADCVVDGLKSAGTAVAGAATAAGNWFADGVRRLTDRTVASVVPTLAMLPFNARGPGYSPSGTYVGRYNPTGAAPNGTMNVGRAKAAQGAGMRR